MNQVQDMFLGAESGDGWARTTDTRIFSPMLYQLSYITPINARQN